MALFLISVFSALTDRSYFLSLANHEPLDAAVAIAIWVWLLSGPAWLLRAIARARDTRDS